MKKVRLLFGSVAVFAMLFTTPTAVAQDDATTTEMSDDMEDDDNGEIGLVGLLGLLGLLGLRRKKEDHRIHPNNKL
ncbi:MAG TPA: WGxxGxxG family protein [Flavobacterium sp.]|jgi:MYXO-CTERM domain-containing protein